jgi:hypothetical protein
MIITSTFVVETAPDGGLAKFRLILNREEKIDQAPIPVKT